MTNEDPQPISALWQNEFNVDNLIDYARASKDLSDYIRVLVKEGYRHLVVPSRGAVPFINAAAAAWRLDVRALPNFDDRLREMTELTYSPFHQKLVLPFSADPQIRRMQHRRRCRSVGIGAESLRHWSGATGPTRT